MSKQVLSRVCLTLGLFFNSCGDDSSSASQNLSAANQTVSPNPIVAGSPLQAVQDPNAQEVLSSDGKVNVDQPPPLEITIKQARIQETLRKANPDYRGQGVFHEEKGQIVAAEFPNCSLRDLSPLKGLTLKILDLSGNPVREIRHLQGMPLNVLWLENTEVVSLSSLSNAKLRELRLNNSPIESLDGLQGQPLEQLYAVATRIKDIEPLRKSNLRGLWLTDSPVADLSPLAGLPLESLTAHRTLVNDLSFVRKLPVIQRLHIAETLIEDLTPLEGIRLTRLVFTPSRIKRGMEAARRLSNLKEIGVAFDAQRQELLPPSQFWAQFGK
jgi:internalin A